MKPQLRLAKYFRHRKTLLAGGARYFHITRTEENGQGRIFWKVGIGFGKFAEQETGSFCGFDRSRVNAIGA